MMLLPGIEAVGLAVYIVKSKTMIVSDLHLGYEESLNKRGVLVPKQQFRDMLHQLELVFKKLKAEGKSVVRVVLNGDIKHEFGRIHRQEWRDVARLLTFLSKWCSEVVVIKGNHDVVLQPVTDSLKVMLVQEWRENGVLVTHGNKIPKVLEKVIIIGHDHPAIGLMDTHRNEKFKCFLVGSYKWKKLIVQPSFNTLTEGSDILRERLLSPFLKSGVDRCNVFVVDQDAHDVLNFGLLKNIKKKFGVW